MFPCENVARKRRTWSTLSTRGLGRQVCRVKQALCSENRYDIREEGAFLVKNWNRTPVLNSLLGSIRTFVRMRGLKKLRIFRIVRKTLSTAHGQTPLTSLEKRLARYTGGRAVSTISTLPAPFLISVTAVIA